MTETIDAVRVLFVGGSPEELESTLDAVVGDATVTAVSDVAAALATPTVDPDCVVYDASGTDSSTVADLKRLRDRLPRVPFVLVTDGDLSALVEADLVSDVTAVVRPGDDVTARLATRVEDAASTHRERTAVRRTHDRYQMLVEQLPVPVLVLHADVVAFANDAAADFFDVPDRSALVGTSFASFVADDTCTALVDRLAAVTDAGDSIPQRQAALRTHEGDRKWATLAARPVAFEGEDAAQVVLTDITEHKRLGARLRDQLDRFSTLFENLSEPVVESRFEGDRAVVENVNPAFAETFGVATDAVVGRTLDEVIVPSDRRETAAELNRRAQAGEHLEVEVRRRTAEGPRDFLLRTVPFEHDEVTRGYAIYIDVTERRERERQLQRQNERLEEVARVVSHDLRNPLNVAQGTVDVLAEAAAEGDRPAFERVQRAHDRMEAIVDDMLTLARQGQSVTDLESVVLDVLARDAWETVGTESATLAVETDCRVKADRSRLLGVFENLFVNAITHAGEGVTVTVGDVDAEGDDTAPIAASTRGFFVADDGPGIPESDRDTVFESGYSTARDSTGFGLAIVQSIVEAHGWDVAITESDSGGARFEITGVETFE